MSLYSEVKKDFEVYKERDPAIRTYWDVLLYPCFWAIRAYRKAHKEWLKGHTFRARLISQRAARKTGIEIHPGAQIGEGFFIDHGTGVVIGETTTIGEHVKLYQHVTLGAKSFALAEDGTPVKGVKRHPDIGDYVVIYAGATILGGDTHIGDDCVIGGSVWLTHSVPAGTLVLAQSAVTDTTMISI